MHIFEQAKTQIMDAIKMQDYIEKILKNIPSYWLRLTTHRLDIYNEKLAKVDFLEKLEELYSQNDAQLSSLNKLPTAYDYIRLGHPLSCILEWAIANKNNLKAANIISFSSKAMPVLAILRQNSIENKSTHIFHTGETPNFLNEIKLKNIYGYQFTIKQIKEPEDIPFLDGSAIFISQQEDISKLRLSDNIDFSINTHKSIGSIVAVNGEKNKNYIGTIQHVRRRETIAMTPANCVAALTLLTGTESSEHIDNHQYTVNKNSVISNIQETAGVATKTLLGSSGLSIQYAITMGLIEDAFQNHQGKAIKIVVPPNCYGGTNEQARRIAAHISNVEVIDLPVDKDNDMTQSIDTILENIAKEDAIPYIFAEIPTNPRVEVPDLNRLKAVLSQKRKTKNGNTAISPVFILDQTFCPNAHFLRENDALSTIRAISYVSASKFPSGGRCTAGYCIGNVHTHDLINKIESHLELCDNKATALQIEILAKQLPSMNQRIKNAYKNTREFVNFIHEKLPAAKINFVSEELATQGFTPSVFSLDLPTKGKTNEEKEAYKRALNLKLINLMITRIPNEAKFCVSYGQLKGSYWTIPATSTQGTTKESDKDYIVRVSLSPNMDINRHKEVFLEFVKNIA